MNLTASEYAVIVINKYYKGDSIYGLARAIARVADKYAKWTMECLTRQSKDTGEPNADNNYQADKQYEAEIKREAYEIALRILSSRLPKH